VEARFVGMLLVAIAGLVVYRLYKMFGSGVGLGEREARRDIRSRSDASTHESIAGGHADPMQQGQPQAAEEISETGRASVKLPPSRFDGGYVRAAFDAVPGIGSCLRRWYDAPYMILNWCVSSWRVRLVPRLLRRYIYRWITTLIRYNELDRDRAWSRDDPMHNVFVPEYEHVVVPTMWVVELFPPSVAAELRTIIERYDPGARLFDDDEAGTILSQSRAGQGYSWLPLASIKDPASQRLLPDCRVERLPPPFWAVELRQIQLGTGLTAIVARFHFNDVGAASLDHEWHRQHEPRLSRRANQLLSESRAFSAYGQTQQVRREHHDFARAWMAQHCPGVFARSREPQPVMDLLILEKHDPTSTQRPAPVDDDALRALGLTETYSVKVAPEVPKFVLDQTSVTVCPALRPGRSWALWGNRAAAAAARPHLSMYNTESDTPEALGHAADREMRDFLLALAVTEFTRIMEAQYTAVRDTARRQHDSFSSRYIQDLRRLLLTLSLNLASTKVDVPTWWERYGVRIPHFGFRYLDPSTDDGEQSGTPEPDFDLTQYLQSQQIADLTRLSDSDRVIRDILATVATLGAARDTHKVSLGALFVAGLSLLVTAIILLITSPGTDSLAYHLWHWLQEPLHPPQR
jgi:hypothetical protein